MKIEYVYDIWGDVYKSMISQIPKGKYFDNRAIVVPKRDTSYFKITVDNINQVHYVYIYRENSLGNAKTSFTFVPNTELYWLPVKLGKGLNVVSVACDENSKATLSVTATYFGTMIDSYAEELYKYSQKKIATTEKDIYINEATRLVSPILSLSKNLTSTHALRTFGLQVIVRSLINNPGTLKALENVCKGLFISTPKIDDIEQKSLFDSAYPFYTGQEYELGKLIFLWIRNPAMLRRYYIIDLGINQGDVIEYTSDKNVDYDGNNEFTDNSDSPLFPEDTNDEDDNGEQDEDVAKVIEIELPRLDRNLPIPFTNIHPWCDRVFDDRETLDEKTPLDVATLDDPFEDGMIGKQCIPYKYDGTKAIAINKHIQIHLVPGKSNITVTLGDYVKGTHIITELRNPILTENGFYINKE
jgi:hypothetical protein